MGICTDWFLADEKDAEAIASIVATEKHSLDDWTHLSLDNVGQMELMQLFGILRGEPGSLESTSGAPLFKDAESLFVFRVEPSFIDTLSAIKPAAISELAAEWNEADGLSNWDVSEVEQALRELSTFAKKAKREDKPVLELVAI